MTSDLTFLFDPQDKRKKFEKESEKYYSQLEKHLALSVKKKESHLQEVSDHHQDGPKVLGSIPNVHSPPVGILEQDKP